MIHASLFSGVGAPELAAYCLGWENAFHCEITPFCRQVLNYWFSNSTSYDDITKTDFRKWQGEIDVLTGGFPCQPFSVAGRRKGAEDNRYLWPEFKRAIREIRPTWVIGENVAVILSMVQPSKSTNMENMSVTECAEEQEFVVESICKDLEDEGYTVQPMVIPACAVGAPHKRDRVWFIAHNNSFRLQKERSKQQTGWNSGIYSNEPISNSSSSGQFNWCSDWTKRSLYPNKKRITTESESEWFQWKCRTCKNISNISIKNDRAPSNSFGNRWSQSSILNGFIEESQKEECGEKQSCRTDCPQSWWRNFPTQSPICGGDDGIPDLLDINAVFKGVIHTKRKNTYTRWRTESVKAYGNAMVPQVIYQIFKCIDEIENNEK